MTKCIENHLTGISKYQKQKQIVLYFHTIIPTTMKPVDDRKKMSIYKIILYLMGNLMRNPKLALKIVSDIILTS